MSAPVAVEIAGLSFRYPHAPRDTLTNIHLKIASSERVAVVGPSGAGKSTLLLHLNGLLPTPAPTTESVARVFVNGVPVVREKLFEVRRAVGFLFQNPEDQLFGDTVANYAAFALEQLGTPRGEAHRQALNCLAAVGLAELADRRPDELSVGEQKRACLAGLLAYRPAVLALDEPTASLDPRARRGVLNLMKGLSQTLIVATHDLELAEELCDRLVILDGGEVRYDGATAAALADADLPMRHGLRA